jgi:NAD(P)H dehydrogenase (quinone)
MRNISIIYFSESGNTEKVANWIAEGAAGVANTQIRLFNLKDTEDPDREYIESSDAVIFGTPTYVANMCWQMKKWFDTRLQYQLGGKIGSAFSTENSPHGGGGELAIMTLVNHMLVKGMLIYSSGSGCGRPFIHIGPTVVRDQMDDRAEICRLFGKRIAEQAHILFD